jgi:Asp-tRNA(Asn)/Glu-tRNA(Gln) amidotransferase B subunit
MIPDAPETELLIKLDSIVLYIAISKGRMDDGIMREKRNSLSRDMGYQATVAL